MAEIERLTTVWDARFDKFEEKLNKVVRSTYGAASKVEKRLDATNDNLTKRFGRGVTTQLNNELDGLAGRAGRAQTVLSGFGAAGLGLAAAFGVVALSVNKAFEALDFGDKLQAQADKLQISAEALQELKFAADETDVPLDKLDSNLQALNSSLGALKLGGKGSGRIAEAFKSLGIGKDDVKDITDASQLLPILADRLGRVTDVAQQARLADRLGVRDLLPLLREGSDGIAQLTQRAHELGLVVSNETVKALADAQRQTELASQQIKTNLTVAFADLAVDIAGATSALAEFLVWLRKIGDEHPRIAALFKEFQNSAGNPFLAPLQGFFGARKRLKQLSTPPGQAFAEELDGSTTRPSFTPTPSAGSGSDAAARKAAQEAKQRREREKRVAQEIARADIDVLESIRGSAVQADEKLIIDQQRLDLAHHARVEEIKQLEEDYKRTKGLEGVSAIEAERLRTLEDEAFKSKSNNLRLDALRAARERALAYEQEITGYTLNQLRDADGLATTAAERRRIQLRILEIERDIERKALEQKLRADPNVTQEQRDRQLAGFDAVSASRRGGILASTAGPLEQFRQSLPDTVDEINEAIERIDVEALKSLEDGLVGIIQGTEKWGDVFRNVANQIIADLIRIAIQQAIINPLSAGLGSIPGLGSLFGGHRASGGPVVPGRVYMVGENGPEPFISGVAGTILPNSAIRSASQARGGPTQVTVVSPVHIHAEGSIGFKELVSSINGRIDASHQAAVKVAVGIASRGMPGRALQASRLGA